MTNLTISLDERVIRAARVRAIQEGSSVSAKVREFLSSYAMNMDVQAASAEALLARARLHQSNANAKRLTPQKKRTRDDVNDRYPTWPRAK